MLTDSCEVLKSELDLFEINPTQTSISSSNYVNYHPTTSISTGASVEFVIISSPENYVDLKNTILYVKNKIIKKDGSNIDPPVAGQAISDEAIVVPINYYHATQFKNIEVYINGRLVSSNDNMAPYRSYLENFLSYSTGAKMGQLTAALYYQDNGDDLDWISSEIAKEDAASLKKVKNRGLHERFLRTQYSHSFETMGRIHSELFLQPKLIPGNVEIRIKLHRADAGFCLMSKTNTDYDIIIEDIQLKVRHCEIASHIREAHQKALLTRKIRYPINQIQMKFFTNGSGRVDLSEPNLVTGVLPSRVVVGLVRSDAFNGSITKNPFNFQNFALENIILRKNGKPTPYEELKLDYRTSHYSQGYLSLYMGTSRLFHDEDIMLPFYQYPFGYALYAFDLRNSETCGIYDLVESGKLQLEIRLGEESTVSITTVVLLEYNKIVELDSDGNVFITE